MRVSENGIEMIKKFEGCKLSSYQCEGGKWTIGFGHTAGVRKGQSISTTQAESYLKDDLLRFEKAVMKYDGKYHWNQNQFDALVSFAFNIGNIDGLTRKGTRSVTDISKKILEYNKIDGKTNNGLKERRNKERELFLKPFSGIIAASTNARHLQLNYKAGKNYNVVVEGLRVRTKRGNQEPCVLLGAEVVAKTKKGQKVKNYATARVGDQIWMCIGTRSNGMEKWVCADTGTKAFVL